ncbi:MAG: phosphonate ABC transporter ATP-binding protein, partial [Rhodospirillales bacterium]|nr:phosphonate ABC transporter ATP-binding protein [Rhodospirillales bacterium]
MVGFEQVTKRFGKKTVALDGVTLDVPEGQFCVVLGPSGSGKSTLLRLLNGMHRPTSGTVRFAGELVMPRRLARVQRRIGMVHQQFNLVPRLSVLDNVLSGTIASVSNLRVMLKAWPRKMRERACELLAEVDLDPDHLYRRASDLSGGQMQRVAIARAFILGPDVVLADEPVASLDPTTSRTVLALLKQAAHKRGATVMCSLHQVDLAVAFADRIVAVRAGRIVFDDTP